MNTRDVDIFGYSLGGSVSEMMDPVERRLPELTPAQIANLTASLAPGAASVDIAGEFPQFPSREMTTEEMLAGPRAPSLAENLAEGKYFSGIMQALGGLGDAATVIPAVGPLIGGILKTPRALQRLLQVGETLEEGIERTRKAFERGETGAREEYLILRNARDDLGEDFIDKGIGSITATKGAGDDVSYRMMHTPTTPQEGAARLDDMTGGGEVFPDDIYSSRGLQFYGDPSNKFDRESFEIIQAVKGNPEAEVTVYRAVPKGVREINPGDFVTLSPEYAKMHGMSGYGAMGDEAGEVISMKVKVKEVFSDGNDLNEFGFFPMERLQRAKEAGFDTDTVYYHATDRFEGDVPDLEFTKIEPSEKGKLGPGIYLSPKAQYSERYINEKSLQDPKFGRGARVLPVFVRGKIGTREDFGEAIETVKKNASEPLGSEAIKRQAQQKMADDGFAGFKVQDELVVFDPKNVRSVNAEFEDLESPELLKASGGAVSNFAEGGIAEILKSRSRFEDPLDRLTQPISADLGPLQMAIPQEEGLRQRAERVLAGLMGDEREDFRRAEKALMAADVLPVLGDVGAAADVRDALSEDDLMGAGIAAISFLPVAGGMAAKGLKSLRDQAPDDGLQFLMNIGPEGIEKAQRLGGFPMPSLAVTRQDLPFESFGEITLVGAPTKFDPGKIKANVVFNADAYTVRAPQPFRIAKKDADLDFRKKYMPISKEFDEGRADSAVYELGKQELKKTATVGSYDNVFTFLQRDPVADVAFLRDQGDNRPIPTRASGLIEQDELRKMVQEYGDARKIWADQELDKYFDREEVFDASVTRDYYTGKGRIFKPYTGEEVVKFMKKRRGAAQEQGAFSVSPGKLRASLTERLGSFKKMRDQSSRLVDNEAFTKFKDESYEKVVELAQSLKPFYKFDSDRFGFPDEVIEMLIESERRSLPRALDEFGFEEVPDDVLDDIREVKSYFRNAPTEYFEAKPQRLVDLSEFEGAIVPQDTPASILKAFQDAGIQVEYYTDNAERLAARKKFAGTAFSVAGGITLIGAQTQQEDFDMNLGIGSI